MIPQQEKKNGEMNRHYLFITDHPNFKFHSVINSELPKKNEIKTKYFHTKIHSRLQVSFGPKARDEVA